MITSTYYISGFSAVEADDSSMVNITYGNYYSVSVICDDNLLPYIDIYSDGYTLHAGLIGGYTYLNNTYTVNITMPVLRSVKADNASDVQVSGFTLTTRLDLILTGASRMNVYLTDADVLSLMADGYSKAEIHSVYPLSRVYLNCSEASSVDLRDMLCAYGEIDIRDSSSVKINMIDPVYESFGLIGQVCRASVLYYRGPQGPGPILFTEGSSLVYY